MLIMPESVRARGSRGSSMDFRDFNAPTKVCPVSKLLPATQSLSLSLCLHSLAENVAPLQNNHTSCCSNKNAAQLLRFVSRCVTSNETMK